MSALTRNELRTVRSINPSPPAFGNDLLSAAAARLMESNIIGDAPP